MWRFVFAMGALIGITSEACAGENPSLPIVHTWGELRQAPRITVTPIAGVKPAQVADKSATFQVAINSDQATTGGAIVLYFLGETGSQNPYTPEEWGDFWLRIDGKTQRPYLTGLDYGDNNHWKTPGGTLFYAEAIPFLTPGNHLVELVDTYERHKWVPSPQNQWVHDPAWDAAAEKRRIFASATIHVKDAPGETWSPFWDVQSVIGGGARSDKDAMGETYAIVQVFNPKGGAYLPLPPRPRWYANLPPADFPLPRLLPQETPGTHVALKMVDSTFVVTLDSQIVGFFPDDYFLTRWWLNGRPVSLDRTLVRPQQARELIIGPAHSPFQPAAFHGLMQLPLLNLAALVWLTHIIHFDMVFKPEWLGAKKGDHVGVQLLFCPASFLHLGPGQDMGVEEEMMDRAPMLPPSNFSQLSNKIEFVYSGDPLHPQTP